MTTSEIDGAHRLPIDIKTSTNDIQQVIYDLVQKIIGNAIKSEAAQRYSRRVIQIVNREEEEAEGQKRKTITGMIKVLGLNHNREKRSDPRLAWFMFHKIYCVYVDINNKE